MSWNKFVLFIMSKHQKWNPIKLWADAASNENISHVFFQAGFLSVTLWRWLAGWLFAVFSSEPHLRPSSLDPVNKVQMVPSVRLQHDPQGACWLLRPCKQHYPVSTIKAAAFIDMFQGNLLSRSSSFRLVSVSFCYQLSCPIQSQCSLSATFHVVQPLYSRPL